jgi:ferredoxin-NADP reductase
VSELLQVKVAAKQRVAPDIASFVLEAADGGVLPAFDAGAHIDVHVPGGLVRQYSLYELPGDRRRYHIGVLRDAQSRGGSAALFDSVEEGDPLTISAPRNHFPVQDDARHAILFAGGIGITPIWCMAQELAAQGRSWKIHYACRSQADMAFLSELKKLDPKFAHLHFDDEASGKVMDLAAAVAEAPAKAHFYCCGPNPMLKAFEAAAASRPKANVHVEYFTPKEDAAAADGLGGFWVELAKSGEEYFIPPGKKVLEVLFDAGVDVDYSCELGICGACETKVISGIPVHHDSVLSEEEQATNEKVMICCCGCKTERLVLDM